MLWMKKVQYFPLKSRSRKVAEDGNTEVKYK